MEMIHYFLKHGKIRIPELPLRLIHEDLNFYFPAGNPRIEDLIPDFDNHDELVSKITSPSGSSQVSDQLLGEASIADCYDYAKALDGLRSSSFQNKDRMYGKVITGNFSKVLRVLRDEGKSGHGINVLRDTIRNHARYLAVLVAHHKTAIIRAHSREPWGTAFSGENEWETVSHTILSSIVTPAVILQKISKILENGTLIGMSDDQAEAYLIKEGILSDDDKYAPEEPKVGKPALEICKKIWRQLSPSIRLRMPTSNRRHCTS